MTPSVISVAICTHNPRADFLARTLDGLRTQTLSTAQWQFVLIDNASKVPLVGRVSLEWHPNAKILREETLGLTPARQCAIAACGGDLVVFVDDDNILAPDYLEQAARLAMEWPQLGLWGCGRFQPVWETPPHPDLAPLLAYLAVNEVARDAWSNHPFDYGATPAGAGICVRAPVAREYGRRVREDPRRYSLGRTGTNLAACEDFDMAQTAIELGFGTGIFRSLSLQHLMAAGRVEESYLLRLVEGHAFSTVLLMNLYGRSHEPPATTLMAWLREFRLRRSLPDIERKIHNARRRGEARAFAHIRWENVLPVK